jgi:hypothetical protein
MEIGAKGVQYRAAQVIKSTLKNQHLLLRGIESCCVHIAQKSHVGVCGSQVNTSLFTCPFDADNGALKTTVEGFDARVFQQYALRHACDRCRELVDFGTASDGKVSVQLHSLVIQ